jgi:hypothetical protein
MSRPRLVHVRGSPGVDWPRSLRAYLAVIAAGDLAWEALHVPLYTWGRARRRLGRGGP